jgi:type IV secretion system protein VirB6
MDPMADAMAVATPSSDGLSAANWTIFTDIYNLVDTPLEGAINSIISALTGYVSGPLKYFIIFWLAGSAIVVAINPSGFPLNRLAGQLIRAALAMSLVASAANYNQWIGQVAQQLPTDIGNALVGTVGGTAVTGGSLFDGVWNKAWTAGLTVYRGLPDSWRGLGLAIGVLVFWLVAVATVAVAFLVYVVSHVLTALVIAIGPLFAAAAVFPMSRFLFSGWLSALASSILAQVLVVTLLSLMMNVETTELAKVVAAQSGGANGPGQMQTLLGVAALLLICALLIKQIPSIAVGIAGGIYHATGVYAASLYAGAAAAARGAGAAIRAVSPASSVGGRIGTTRPAGRSLSGGEA